MSWNGSGTFNRLYSWIADRAAGLMISSVRMDADTNDIVSNGLANCLTRDGQGPPTANLPMNGFRHVSAAPGQARTDYATVGQVQDSSTNWAIAGGTGAALTVTLLPAPTALPDGQLVYLRATAANLTTAPTLNVNGLGAHQITKQGGQALAIGDIQAGAELVLRYNLAAARYELLNPPAVSTGTLVIWAAAAAPGGYLLCNGQAVSRTTYAALFAVIGTTYGAGDGSTNFNVPNLTGRAPVGLDTASAVIPGAQAAGLGNQWGEAYHTLSLAEMPSHNHGVNDPTHAHPMQQGNIVQYRGGSIGNTVPSLYGAPAYDIDMITPTMAAVGTGISIQLNGSSIGHNNIQPSFAVNYVIKT